MTDSCDDWVIFITNEGCIKEECDSGQVRQRPGAKWANRREKQRSLGVSWNGKESVAEYVQETDQRWIK